jgi:sirohydrochlorin cobaltochelatase
MGKTAIMVCGHGSRDTDAMAEFQSLTRGMAERAGGLDIGAGYLEFARPTIREALDGLVARGATDILAVPGMLFAAGHVKNDLPSEINEFARDNPGVSIRFGRDLTIDPKLLRASTDRIEAALEAAGDEIERSDTLLVVIGRGTSDPDANSNVAKVARMLWEGMGFGWAEIGFSGVAFPRTGPALERAVKLGFKRILVFPYFLFTGVLVKRIHAETDEVAARHPEIEFIKVDYLKDHPLVLDALYDRVLEIDRGENNMNCQLCKYREQVVGYERDVGKVQEGHHHHVRGIGTDGGHGHDHHGHHHDHGHDHGHAHGHDHGHDHAHPHPHSHSHSHDRG